jgi:hypothetical protein
MSRHEPVIEGQTLDQILERLKNSGEKLEDEGRYVMSNSIWLAQEAINELRKHQRTHDQGEQTPQQERCADQDCSNEVGG